VKALALMVLTGVGLFTGTVAGLLAAQGRLNHEGTRGLPLVHALFPAPKAEPVTAAEQVKGPAPDVEPRLAGLGREPELPRELGPEVELESAMAEGRALESTAGENPGSAEHATAADAGSAPAAPHAPGDTGFAQRVDSLMAQGQYRRGKLFEFPQLASGMSVAEIDEILASAQELRQALERQREALDQREAELAAREADLEDRERAVLERMREVLQHRGELEEQVAAFRRSYSLVASNEAAELQSYAETLSALPAEKSSQIILRYWQTEDGADKAVKILKLMEKDPRDELFNLLTAEQTQAILDRLARTVVEPAGGSPGAPRPQPAPGRSR
jgi:hypothetical protein